MSTTDNNKRKFEYANCVSENGDSIYSPEFEERNGGQVFVNESKIRDIVKDELDKRFGPSINKRENDL